MEGFEWLMGNFGVHQLLRPLSILALLSIAACSPEKPIQPVLTKEPAPQDLKSAIVQKYKGMQPIQWGERVDGVKTRLDTNEKVIALTFDACGGPNGTGYDEKLINYLIKENIPVTLFINSRWIDANPQIFQELAKNPLFEIENHGTHHKPLSVVGKSAYGISGTQSVEEAMDEVLLNQEKIQSLTGKKPQFFRSGTAYYDDVAVRMVGELGDNVVNYNVLGDAGATFSKTQVKNALLHAAPGSIALLHMNHPEKETAEGVILSIPELKKMGFRFVKLNEYPLK